ncbi:MAG: response regulator [Gemmatimonadetes bacterium]|uniref:Response regulator n=1 Tax=Candidatus Kutchimonas denitrificans TaxID=3056748 RepID=A0AAE5CBX9_9BACT|nr:response regulator [Gemmatimonadota bacterium]NIR75108.1 response regulator [Candidatus Kutchimonas denitrificans]NIS00940.1 response regulator [Gemmatimonadota bacterium]NIT66557.1 response regulator [Gemmatimonadota bacterium]NIU52903.1 response regulator [Gemmatimonadota bacterium]
MEWTNLDLPDRAAPAAAMPAPADSPVILVDDEESVVSLLTKVLEEEGYPVEGFDSGQEALQRIEEGGVALMVTDIRMPDMDGMQLASLALEEDPDIAVLVLTGAPDTTSAVESLRLGVDDYLLKPVAVDDLVVAVGRALRRRSLSLYRHQIEAWLRAEVDKRMEQVERQAEELQEMSLATLRALIRAMEAKDPYLKGHSEKVAELGVKMAIHLDLESHEIEEVRIACLLHDIGMIAIRESVLHKEARLSDEEYRHVQEHAEIGASILRPLTNLGGALDFVRCHHERLDGTGYPRGLAGDEVPQGAQIVGVAEIFVSMTETRPHRQAHPQEKALEMLRSVSGKWYASDVVEALDAVVQGREKGTAG